MTEITQREARGRSEPSATALFLNAAVLDFGETAVTAEVLPAAAAAPIRELRRQHRSTHVLRREGASILAVAVADGAPRIGGDLVQMKLGEHPELACHLWREALLRQMAGRSRQIIRGVPVQVASKATDDVLGPRVEWERQSGKPRLLRAIDVRVAYGFDAWVFRPPNPPGPASALPVVVLDVFVLQRITAPVSELHSWGADLRGAYAGELRPIDDVRVAPELKLLGRLQTTSAGTATLEEEDGIRTRDASLVFVEASRTNLRRLLECALPNQWRRAEDDIMSRTAAIHEGAAWVKRIQKALEVLRQDSIEVASGARAVVGDLINPARWPIGVNTVRKADAAVFVFDAAGRKVDDSTSRGIRAHGPYSRLAPIPRTPRVCLICQASQQGVAEQLLYKFLYGIPNSIFDRGFLRTYGLENCQPVPFTARGASARAYHEAAQQALRAASESGQPWDLAFVQVEDRTHQLRGDDNPYLVTKAFFLTQQIPVQEFRFETAQTPDSQLAWSLSNMALATYAKLGGIPWLLRADPTTTHELVVGISSAWVRERRLSQGDRLVGITTVFSGDGSYFLHTVSKAVPFDDYSNAMLESLRTAIDRVRRERNWLKGERVRLVFHAFKPLKDAEADAVKRLAGELSDFELEFAFLHVASDTTIQLFDRNALGVRAGQSGLKKGVHVPDRGLMVALSERDMLVATTGARELKRPIDGAPVPLLLHLHGASTFRDLRYLGQQVFLFASHSWRGFQPAPVPVTVSYSHLIARLMGRLATTSRWNPDVLCGRIGTTRWFL